MTGAGAVAGACKIIHNHSSSAPRQLHSIFPSDAGTGASHNSLLVLFEVFTAYYFIKTQKFSIYVIFVSADLRGSRGGLRYFSDHPPPTPAIRQSEAGASPPVKGGEIR